MNCDHIARWYRWLEFLSFGRALQLRRGAFLSELKNARRILVLGDGDGRALVPLLKAAPVATIDYIDRSAKMVALARSRAGTRRVTYHHADALTLPLPKGEYDAIVTHFFLDCLNENEAAALVARAAAASRGDAQWVISEFQQQSRWTAFFVRSLYLFFRLTTGLRTTKIADYRSHLAQHGFRMRRRENAWGGLLVSELWRRTP